MTRVVQLYMHLYLMHFWVSRIQTFLPDPDYPFQRFLFALHNHVSLQTLPILVRKVEVDLLPPPPLFAVLSVARVSSVRFVPFLRCEQFVQWGLPFLVSPKCACGPFLDS